MSNPYVQIPNALVFKSIIINYTANPNRRSDFVVGIGYTDAISHVQELIIQVLHDHPVVLESPEPHVVVENLGAATVNLHIYFWFDANKYAPMKIKSSLIRLTKHTLEEAGISMPDEAREIIFPDGVPILASARSQSTFTNGNRDDKQSATASAAADAAPEAVTSAAEGHLSSEKDEIQEQANLSRSPEEGENLLDENR